MLLSTIKKTFVFLLRDIQNLNNSCIKWKLMGSFSSEVG